jgi:glycosyltransferase involved in cell wall biosynthesis
MPLVSVIIPAFNSAHSIGNAVGSAQGQSEGRIEIIVVDDASTDGTARVVEGLAARDPRVRLVRMERNGGPGIARNAGLDAAGGEWIALLDADDRYHPHRLQALLDAGASHKAQLVADNLSLVLTPGMRRIGPMIPADWLSKPSVVSPAAFVEGNIQKARRQGIAYGYLKPIIRRDFLDRTGIRYDDLRFSEDYIFALRCLLAAACYVMLPDAMYDYAVDAAGLTSRHSADDLTRLIRLERTLLLNPGVGPGTPLHHAMTRHIRSVELALGWFRFAQAIKRRDPFAAFSQVFQSPAHFRHIGREGLRAMPRAFIQGRRRKHA